MIYNECIFFLAVVRVLLTKHYTIMPLHVHICVSSISKIYYAMRFL